MDINNPILWLSISHVLSQAIYMLCGVILFVGVPVKIAKHAFNSKNWVVNGIDQSMMWVSAISILLAVIQLIIVIGQVAGENTGF